MAFQWQSITAMGRTHEQNGFLWLAFSGSGITFSVTGTRCSILLHGDSTSVHPTPETHTARYALYVDSCRIAEGMMDTPERRLTVFEGESVRTVRVMLVKLSESAMSALAVQDVCTDGTLEPVPDRKHFIEFVGDSITCGYGIDTTAPDQTFHTNNEDVTKAYAWQAADLLNADRRMVSLSGWGIISGWTPDPDKPRTDQLLPRYYDRCGFSYANCDGYSVQGWPWSFAGREPDVVAVNLGTNDASYAEDDPAKQERYCREYQAFLKKIRACNPHAKLLCMLGVMGDMLWNALERAVKEYQAETGDQAVETLHLEAIRPESEGYVADFHPTVTTHTRIARAVADKLAAMLD